MFTFELAATGLMCASMFIALFVGVVLLISRSGNGHAPKMHVAQPSKIDAHVRHIVSGMD